MSFIKFNSKDKKKIFNLPGTRSVPLRDVCLTPSGIISLDPIIGKGLTVGSINLIEESDAGSFAQLFHKFFVAEGIMWKHVIFNASLDINPYKMVQELPSPVTPDDPYFKSDPVDSNNELKIAWRYQNSPSVQSTLSSASSFSHVFDVTNYLQQEALDDVEISYWPPKDRDEFSYEDLISAIHKKIQTGGFSTKAQQPRKNVLRISLFNIGSPLYDGDICSFFYKLRALLKSTNAVCNVSIPIHLLEKKEIACCEHLSDSVLRIESLLNTKIPFLEKYHGFLTIKKLPAINYLSYHVPVGTDWAFKIRKRRLTIEKFHLPPELVDSDQREQDETIVSCGSSSQSKLDF